MSSCDMSQVQWNVAREKKTVLLGRKGKKTGQEKGCCRQARFGPKATTTTIHAAKGEPEEAECSHKPPNNPRNKHKQTKHEAKTQNRKVSSSRNYKIAKRAKDL